MSLHTKTYFSALFCRRDSTVSFSRSFFMRIYSSAYLRSSLSSRSCSFSVQIIKKQLFMHFNPENIKMFFLHSSFQHKCSDGSANKAHQEINFTTSNFFIRRRSCDFSANKNAWSTLAECYSTSAKKFQKRMFK